MSLKAGIVGLPNVGKSTLFNAITNSHVEAANYPFATISPNTGVVNVPDERLDFLSNLFKPTRTIAATFEFYESIPLVTRTMGSPYFVANSKSLSSPDGTPITAPVPYEYNT